MTTRLTRSCRSPLVSRTQIAEVAATGMRMTRSSPIWMGSPSSRPSSGTHICPSSQQPAGRTTKYCVRQATSGRGRAKTPRKAPKLHWMAADSIMRNSDRPEASSCP